MSADEQATLASLEVARERFRTETVANGGRVIDTAGDSVLAVFETAVGATRAALAVQDQLEAAAKSTSEEGKCAFG